MQAFTQVTLQDGVRTNLHKEAVAFLTELVHSREELDALADVVPPVGSVKIYFLAFLPRDSGEEAGRAFLGGKVLQFLAKGFVYAIHVP